MAAQLVETACKVGASASSVSVSQSEAKEVSVRAGDVESIDYNDETSFEVTVYVGQRRASVSFTPHQFANAPILLEKTVKIATAMPADAAFGLPESSQLAFQPAGCQLYYPTEVDLAKITDSLLEAEKVALVENRIKQSQGVQFSMSESQYVQANSQGFCGSYQQTYYSVSAGFIAEDDAGMQRNGEGSVRHVLTELPCFSELAQQTAMMAVKQLGAKPIETQVTPVVFSDRVARSLVGHVLSAISGRSQYLQASFLNDCLDKAILPSWFALRQQPHQHNGIGSAPFDNEGVETQSLSFIEQGYCRHYVLNSYTARKLGLTSTGNAGGIYNGLVEPNMDSEEDLLKQMDRGLYVTELLGQGVNLTTGEYSRGAAGFWVEHGEIQYPVAEITISGNLAEMFNRLVAVSPTIDPYHNIKTGAWLIEQMQVAGK